MRVHHLVPFSLSKDLGSAYNQAMSMIPDGDCAMLTDYDVMLLTPDARTHIQAYAEKFPGAVLTCYTNRIHPLSKQLYYGEVNNDPDILTHMNYAESLKEHLYNVTEVTGSVSGFLMVIPKDIWERVKFPETGKCIAVDTEFFRRIREKGIKVLRMDGIYVFHIYRLGKSITDKSHL